MNNFQTSPQFLRGRAGEQRVAAFLKRRGWYILPASDYSGSNGEKAPKIQNAHDGIIVPDFGIARSGLMKWAEVKSKWEPTYTIISGTYDHGIGYRKWLHYLEFQEQVGAPVWLFIIEEKSQTLLFKNLDDLGMGRVYTGGAMDAGGMMFWPVTQFRRVVLDEIPGLFDPAILLDFEEEKNERRGRA